MDPNLTPSTPMPVDQPQQPLTTPPVPPKIDSKIIKRVSFGSAVVILVILGIGSYVWRDSQAKQQAKNDIAEIKKLQDKIIELGGTIESDTDTIVISQRDTKRKDDLGRMITGITAFSSNNRGSLPSGMSVDDDKSWPSFMRDYMDNDGSFVDPSGNEYAIFDTDGAGRSLSDIGDFNSKSSIIYITTGAICSDDNESLLFNKGSRKVALQLKLESDGIACDSNN